MLEGWICPRCKRVNAPWVERCDCIDDSLRTNNINCCHQWVPVTVSTTGTTYRCSICGKTKTEYYNIVSYVHNITNY